MRRAKDVSLLGRSRPPTVLECEPFRRGGHCARPPTIVNRFELVCGLSYPPCLQLSQGIVGVHPERQRSRSRTGPRRNSRRLFARAPLHGRVHGYSRSPGNRSGAMDRYNEIKPQNGRLSTHISHIQLPPQASRAYVRVRRHGGHDPGSGRTDSLLAAGRSAVIGWPQHFDW